MGGQFNPVNNGQNLGTYGFYRESNQNSDADRNQIRDFFEAARQNSVSLREASWDLKRH